MRQGLLLQAIVLLRSAFEIATQDMLFLDRAVEAERWLTGKKIQPRQVRELTSMPQTQRDLYKKLATLAHPNYEASRYSSIPVPYSKGLGVAYLYGGWFAPNDAAQIAAQFLWAQLVFLESFYAAYSTELEKHNLLWAPGVAEARESSGGGQFSWSDYLVGWRNALTELTNEVVDNTHADAIEIALSMSDYTPEQKAQWRQSFRAALDTDRPEEGK